MRLLANIVGAEGTFDFVRLLANIVGAEGTFDFVRLLANDKRATMRAVPSNPALKATTEATRLAKNRADSSLARYT